MSQKRRKTILSTRRTYIIATAIIIALAMMFVFIHWIWQGGEKRGEEISSVISGQEETHYRHPLTGVWTEISVSSLPQVFGVMIDEHVDAQPLSGIDQAFLVIEALTEAGIPRLLAFFSEEQEVEKIGPVRSARPYFVDFVQAWDGVYAHVGGSPEALAQIVSQDVRDLNQYWYGSFFWRASSRYAPHNVYTSTELLRSFVEGEEDPVYETWTFKDSATDQVSESAEIFLTFSSYPWANPSWRFDPTQDRYQRFLEGEPYPLESEATVFADNVVILFTDVEVVDEIGRRHIRTTGEGEGYVLQDGQTIPIIWKRPENKNIPRFYAEDGNEIFLNAGTTWIEVLPSAASVSFSAL